MMRRLQGAAILSIVASMAMAQVPLTLRGTIDSVASHTLVVKAQDGMTRNIRLADDVHVFMPKQASLAS
jgi:hypothetical protein